MQGYRKGLGHPVRVMIGVQQGKSNWNHFSRLLSFTHFVTRIRAGVASIKKQFYKIMRYRLWGKFCLFKVIVTIEA